MSYVAKVDGKIIVCDTNKHLNFGSCQLFDIQDQPVSKQASCKELSPLSSTDYPRTVPRRPKGERQHKRWRDKPVWTQNSILGLYRQDQIEKDMKKQRRIKLTSIASYKKEGIKGKGVFDETQHRGWREAGPVVGKNMIRATERNMSDFSAYINRVVG